MKTSYRDYCKLRQLREALYELEGECDDLWAGPSPSPLQERYEARYERSRSNGTQSVLSPLTAWETFILVILGSALGMGLGVILAAIP
jgi:hypothetical protein